MKSLVVLLLLLSLTPVAFAAISPEPVVIRTVAYTPENRTYTFSCYPGPGLDSTRHWAVRPDVTQATFEYQSTSPFLTYVLDEDVMYHISCGAMNGTQFVQSDYHIDRRLARQPEKPHITVSWSEGTHFAAHCDPPVGVTNYAMQWWTNNYVDHISRSDLAGQEDINTSVPYPKLWELVCGTWDIDRSRWSQISYTVEFFATGQAYTPSVTGCIPGEPCPWANGTVVPPPLPNGTNTTNSTNTTLPPSPPPPNGTNSTNTTGSCFASAFTIPLTCTGGAITSDAVTGGCRLITCTGASGSVTAKACNKPGNNAPQYFEMYRQAATGTAPKVCLGTTCIQGNGFAKSLNFPICIGTVPPTNSTNTTLPPPPPTNSTNSTNTTLPPPPNSTGNLSATLVIAPWFPQGRNYVFHCNAAGFTPTHYDWVFGDGQRQNGRTTKDVYHTYAPGAYAVACVARNAQASANGTLQVTVV